MCIFNPSGRVSVIFLFACHFSRLSSLSLSYLKLNNAIRILLRYVPLGLYFPHFAFLYDCQTFSMYADFDFALSLALSLYLYLSFKLNFYLTFFFFVYVFVRSTIYVCITQLWQYILYIYALKKLRVYDITIEVWTMNHHRWCTTHTFYTCACKHHIQSNSIAYCVHACIHESLTELK